MATKKTKRRAPSSKKSGSTFPAMSDLLKSIEDNFRALASMVSTGSSATPKRKVPKRKAPKRKMTSKTPTTRVKAAVKRAAAKAKRALPKVKKRARRADKRPSASSPI